MRSLGTTEDWRWLFDVEGVILLNVEFSDSMEVSDISEVSEHLAVWPV